MLVHPQLSLRSLEPSDVKVMMDWENNSSLWKISNTTIPFSKNTIEQFAATKQDIYLTKQYRFIIHLTEKNIPIGCVDLFEFDPRNLRAGVGILIDEPYQNKGFAKITLELLVEYAREVLLLNQLFSNIITDNVASIHLFESVGFKLVGVKKQWINTTQGFQDEALYQLLF